MMVNNVELEGIISSVKISECHEGYGYLLEVQSSYALSVGISQPMSIPTFLRSRELRSDLAPGVPVHIYGQVRCVSDYMDIFAHEVISTNK